MQTFEPSKRLLNAAEYKSVFDKPCAKAGSNEFLMLVVANNLSHPRLGVIVAKKHVKLATQRNYYKRVFREHFRQQYEQLPCVDCVVIARPNIKTASTQQLFTSLDKQWQKIQKQLA